MHSLEPLSCLETKRKIGTEAFTAHGEPLGFHVVSFWQWATSDLAGNLVRGALAEYLVAQALGTAAGVREPWQSFDLHSPGGLRIEVKSAAYLHGWWQPEPAAIRFSIRETRTWDPATNEMGDTAKRHADLYVFALLDHTDKATLNPLELSQWRFFVVPVQTLAEQVEPWKQLTLHALLSLAPEEATFETLPQAVAKFEPTKSRSRNSGIEPRVPAT